MAPGAWLVNLKVLGADGSGSTADAIAAIDWTIANQRTYNIRIINLSLGHPVYESYLDDPLVRATQRAADAGILVVAAVGNRGKTADGRPAVGFVDSPGNGPSVLTVGAVNTRGTAGRSDDVMATYSSRGPTPFDGVLKPELVAPGNKIVAASAAGSYLSRDVSRAGAGGPGEHRLHRVERDEHGGGGGVGRGGAGARGESGADAGAGEGDAAADEFAGGGGGADRGGGGESECGGGDCGEAAGSAVCVAIDGESIAASRIAFIAPRRSWTIHAKHSRE